MPKNEVECPHCGRVEAPGGRCSGCGKKATDPVEPKAIAKAIAKQAKRVKLIAPPIIVTPPTKSPRKRNQGMVQAVAQRAVTPQMAGSTPPPLTNPGETELETIGIRVDDVTREAWLLAAVAKMRPWFPEGRVVPEVRISIGWPGGRSARLDALGQCFGPAAVADGLPAIFITPSQDQPVQVLATTLHEMVHAAGEMNHRGGFRKLARAVGFDPQPGASGTSSTYRTPELAAQLAALYDELGPFPHAPVNKSSLVIRPGGQLGPAVQGTRMLKVACSVCGYSVRTTRKWLEVAIPTCPNLGCADVGIEMVPEAK